MISWLESGQRRQVRRQIREVGEGIKGSDAGHWQRRGKYHLITVGTQPNNPIAYTPGLELHHPTMSMLGVTEAGYIYIYRER